MFEHVPQLPLLEDPLSFIPLSFIPPSVRTFLVILLFFTSVHSPSGSLALYPLIFSALYLHSLPLSHRVIIL